MKILKYNPQKCTGCLSCQLACSFQKLQGGIHPYLYNKKEFLKGIFY